MRKFYICWAVPLEHSTYVDCWAVPWGTFLRISSSSIWKIYIFLALPALPSLFEKSFLPTGCVKMFRNLSLTCLWYITNVYVTKVLCVRMFCGQLRKDLLLSLVSCLFYDVSCMMYFVSCLLSRVSCVTAHVSRLLSHASCLTPLVSSLQSQISCHMSPVLRVLKYKIISELVAQLAVVRN